MTYSIKETYLTIQGEGAYTGRVAVFCRFAGCNLWSGLEEDRTTAVCRFCDTEFVGIDGPGGGKFDSPANLPNQILSFWIGVDDPIVILCTNQDGSRAALPASSNFMKSEDDTLRMKRMNFNRPSGVKNFEICSITKDIPTNLCTVESEIFIQGTEPSQVCKVHRRN